MYSDKTWGVTVVGENTMGNRGHLAASVTKQCRLQRRYLEK